MSSSMADDLQSVVVGYKPYMKPTQFRLFQSLFGYLWFLLVFYIAFMTRDVTESVGFAFS